MKVLVQRVSRASVSVEGEGLGEIGQGVLLLCGVAANDTLENLSAMANKIANLRIFPDENGKFQYSLLEIKGAALLVPQFTLFADTSKGRRPEFFGAMRPPLANELFEQFTAELKAAGVGKIETGKFGAHMQVELCNDGPVTMMLEL